MKLRMLRQHFVYKNSSWVPKRSFDDEEDIEKELGFSFDSIRTYTCDFCNSIHIATYDVGKSK
jgi:hypothetical protein